MTRPLFHVTELFVIRGRGLVVAADIPVSKANFKLCIGDAVEFARSDGSRLRTVVRGIEMLNPYNPDRPFAFLVGQEVARSDIERGAAVWQVQAADAQPRAVAEPAPRRFLCDHDPLGGPVR